MKRHILIYGFTGGLLIVGLRWAQYRFVVVDRSIEIYAALIATTFAILGIWIGLRITRRRAEPFAVQTASFPAPFVPDGRKVQDLGLTRRELQILELIASGLSNREIAEKLFVSENTVKTHSSRVLSKLGARRRTQAVQIGKDCGLLP